MPDPQPHLPSVDELIAGYAAGQHANITRAQLLSVGLDDGDIRYRLTVGRLHTMYAGVYAVGHRPTSQLAHATAAVLACGLGASSAIGRPALCGASAGVGIRRTR
jgi:hypothetical protein